MSKKCLSFMLYLLAVQALFVGEVVAHPMAPSLLKIEEQSDTQYTLYWKQPVKSVAPVSLVPELPSQCKTLSTATINRIEKGAIVSQWLTSCEQGLADQVIKIGGLNKSKTTVIMHMVWLNGVEQTVLLTADKPEVKITQQLNGVGRFYDYIQSGVSHLLEGYDHILLIACLLMLFRHNTRQLILIFSAFTLGHGLSLALAVHNLIPISPTTVECLILLTLIWSAMEVLAAPRTKPTYLKTYPYLLITAFGLVHGAGFANSIFTQVDKSVVSWLDLLGFNLGIEVTQVALVLLFIPILALLERYQTLKSSLRTSTGYTVGGLSMFWLLQQFS